MTPYSAHPTNRMLVVTTISGPNPVLVSLAEGSARLGRRFVVIGDKKTPADFNLTGTDYYDLARQSEVFPDLAGALPIGHYTRKNVGYLIAMRGGATEIQETDDDNFPLSEFWRQNTLAEEISVIAGNRWVNPYSPFSSAEIWPRGLPLEYVLGAQPREVGSRFCRRLIVQGLADENPDVDAIFRLTRKLPITFAKRHDVMIEPGTWAPFNSQNTIFKSEVFPLLYLPSHCSFRMTDIWRSFVAQRCLWELDEGVVFHSATVRQERNQHSLIKDFEDEIPGYLLNDKVAKALESLRLDKTDLKASLILCYEGLIAAKIFPQDELVLVRKWVNAIGSLRSH